MTSDITRLAGKPTLRVAGLMSGTSADGVDVAIVDIDRRGVKLLAFDTFGYPPSVRQRIFRLFQPHTGRVDEVCHLNFALGELFASALTMLAKKSGLGLGSIDLIGSHGQTIYHIPQGRTFQGRRLRSTLQIGEPCVIAERTGITTVADFRPRDVAAGGEGAPLVPYADHFLFRHSRRSRAIQNIGGIANVTYLPPACEVSDIIAFDTGPGNMTIDRAAYLASKGRKRCDVGGRLAARGRVHEALLAELMRHRFLRRRPPKSTGREQFGEQFTDRIYGDARKKGIAARDILATLTAFTASSISDAYRRHLPGSVDEVILCGGGAHNHTLRRMLQHKLQPAKVMLMDSLGLNADAKEAVSFAVLAYATVRGVASSVPSATGAKRPAVLGKIVVGKC